jgi:hypothetical protein
MGHADTRTTENYRHQVRLAIPHAVTAWNKLLDEKAKKAKQKTAEARQQRQDLKKAS